jgi:hypothetical protein
MSHRSYAGICAVHHRQSNWSNHHTAYRCTRCAQNTFLLQASHQLSMYSVPHRTPFCFKRRTRVIVSLCAAPAAVADFHHELVLVQCIIFCKLVKLSHHLSMYSVPHRTPCCFKRCTSGLPQRWKQEGKKYHVAPELRWYLCSASSTVKLVQPSHRLSMYSVPHKTPCCFKRCTSGLPQGWRQVGKKYHVAPELRWYLCSASSTVKLVKPLHRLLMYSVPHRTPFCFQRCTSELSQGRRLVETGAPMETID